MFLPGDCDSGCEKLADLLGWRVSHLIIILLVQNSVV